MKLNRRSYTKRKENKFELYIKWSEALIYDAFTSQGTV